MFGSFGGFHKHDCYDRFHKHMRKHDVFFNEKKFNANDGDNEFNVVFGKGEFDFRDVDLSNGPKKLKINTIFGASSIKIDKDMPIKIVADAVFGEADLPGNFGQV